MFSFGTSDVEQQIKKLIIFVPGNHVIPQPFILIPSKAFTDSIRQIVRLGNFNIPEMPTDVFAVGIRNIPLNRCNTYIFYFSF